MRLPARLAPGSAQTPPQRTYANPIDVDYRYNFEQKNAGISYRSGADPVIVVHRGEYYLWVKRTGSRSRASAKTVFRP